MKNAKVRIKKFAVLTLIVTNIFVVGGVVGAIQGYNYAKGQAHTTAQAIQAALKSVPTVQAASLK